MVIGRLKQQKQDFEGLICIITLYNYIGKGVFKNVINADPWEKCKRRRRRYRYIRRVSLKNTCSGSIEDSSEEINKCLEYGRWEGDCIVGCRVGQERRVLYLKRAYDQGIKKVHQTAGGDFKSLK